MAKGLSKAQVSLLGDDEVKVTRRFAAPRTLVYEAYTTPSLVQRWLLGPTGWTMPVCEMDVRVGGTFRWRWRNEQDGREFGFHGRYREILPPHRLVSTQFFDSGVAGRGTGPGVMVSVDLAEEAGFTTLVSLMKFASREARDAALSTGMTGGMEHSYQRLDHVLAVHHPRTNARVYA